MVMSHTRCHFSNPQYTGLCVTPVNTLAYDPVLH
nr:MAG TPA: hypothetical protein [Caudoviricetes sp.]